jgi:hypothetical protein
MNLFNYYKSYQPEKKFAHNNKNGREKYVWIWCIEEKENK